MERLLRILFLISGVVGIINAKCTDKSVKSLNLTESHVSEISDEGVLTVTCTAGMGLIHVNGSDFGSKVELNCNNETEEVVKPHEDWTVVECMKHCVLSAPPEESNLILVSFESQVYHDEVKTYTDEKQKILPGTSANYECKHKDMEIGESMLTTFKRNCNNEGALVPDSFPICSVPKSCGRPAVPPEESGLRLALSNQQNYKAFRTAHYECKEEDQVLSDGALKLDIPCQEDGNFRVPDPLPTCRLALNCTGDPPSPPENSTLVNTTAGVHYEFEAYKFVCKDLKQLVGKYELSIILNINNTLNPLTSLNQS